MRRSACLLLAVLAPACGRSEGPPPADAPFRVRVAMLPVLSLAPLLIADEEGFFRRRGVEVEFVPLARSVDGLPSLIDGKLDVLSSAMRPSLLNAMARGARIRIVADKGHLDPAGCTYLALVARPDLVASGALARPDPSRTWVFAVEPEAFGHLLVERALSRAGIPSARVRLTQVDRAAEEAALRGGSLDVALAVGAWVPRLLANGSAAVWHPGQELLPDYQFLVLLFGPSLLEGDPERGVRFMASYLDGVRQYNQGKTERNLEILERRTGMDRQLLVDGCWIATRDDGQINVDSVLEYQAWSTGKGILDRALEAREFWDPRFVEGAAARAASERAAR